MSVVLNSHTYRTSQTAYAHLSTKIGGTDRGLTGLPLRVESGFFDNTYNLTLLCTLTELTNLRNDFAIVDPTGTPANNLLDFVDEEGTEWNPASSGTGIKNTGVYFTAMGEPKPVSVNGWTAGNRYLVQVTFVVNASGLVTA